MCAMEGKGEGRGTKTKMAPAVAEAIAATLDSKDERKRKLLSIICGMVPANDNAKITLIFHPLGGGNFGKVGRKSFFNVELR